MISLVLRNANYQDSDFFFELKNDTAALAFSVSKKKINKSDHQNWYKNQLKNNKNLLFVAENIIKEKVGYVRYDMKDDAYICSVNIKKKFRGMGFGKQLLLESEKYLPTSSEIRAFISMANRSSIKLFESCGYSYFSEYDDDFLIYNKEIN